MLDFIDSPADVIAIRMTGKITGEDLNALGSAE